MRSKFQLKLWSIERIFLLIGTKFFDFVMVTLLELINIVVRIIRVY